MPVISSGNSIIYQPTTFYVSADDSADKKVEPSTENEISVNESAAKAIVRSLNALANQASDIGSLSLSFSQSSGEHVDALNELARKVKYLAWAEEELLSKTSDAIIADVSAFYSVDEDIAKSLMLETS